MRIVIKVNRLISPGKNELKEIFNSHRRIPKYFEKSFLKLERQYKLRCNELVSMYLMWLLTSVLTQNNLRI